MSRKLKLRTLHFSTCQRTIRNFADSRRCPLWAKSGHSALRQKLAFDPSSASCPWSYFKSFPIVRVTPQCLGQSAAPDLYLGVFQPSVVGLHSRNRHTRLPVHGHLSPQNIRSVPPRTTEAVNCDQAYDLRFPVSTRKVEIEKAPIVRFARKGPYVPALARRMLCRHAMGCRCR